MSHDSIEGLLRDVDAVDWKSLEGAYGASDGSLKNDEMVQGDVPGALRVLALEEDFESDDFSDALLDVMGGHVWHQGTVYPVTPVVVPFIFRILRLRAEEGIAEKLVEYLNVVKSSADPVVDAVFANHQDAVDEWGIDGAIEA